MYASVAGFCEHSCDHWDDKNWNFLTSSITVKFSGKTLCNGVGEKSPASLGEVAMYSISLIWPQ
jgi:hypothetical protein